MIATAAVTSMRKLAGGSCNVSAACESGESWLRNIGLDSLRLFNAREIEGCAISPPTVVHWCKYAPHDCYPGGVGQSAPLYRMADRLLRLTTELLAACECEAGCPSCVGPVGEVGERGKEAAMRIARELLAG